MVGPIFQGRGHPRALGVCRQVSDRPELVDIDAMRAAAFKYPHGMTAALGCIAAERLGGQAVHWDMFYRLQPGTATASRAALRAICRLT